MHMAKRCSACEKSFPEEELVNFGNDHFCSDCKETHIQLMKEGVKYEAPKQKSRLGCIIVAVLASILLVLFLMGLGSWVLFSNSAGAGPMPRPVRTGTTPRPVPTKPAPAQPAN